ncbi:MAG: cytochrome c maturation protein CcmE [Sandaracinaceae bacterium]
MEDDDLAEEIRQGDESTSADASPAVSPARSVRRGEPEGWRLGGMVIPPWLGMSGVLLLLGGGVAFLLWGTSASDAFVYSKLVNEVMESPDEFRDRELRVEGQLQAGSVVFEDEPCEHRFTLEREGFTMDVRFPRCVVPDTFRDDMPMDVVVQGHLQADDTFLANEVIPRCPSKYEMQERRENGEEMPHGDPAASAAAASTAT